MRAHEEASLVLQYNGITFQNGVLTSEDQLLEHDVLNNRQYRRSPKVQEGLPFSVVHLGDGYVTLNDTNYIFPYTDDHYWEDGELLGPEEILENAYRARKAAAILDGVREKKEKFLDMEAEALREVHSSGKGFPERSEMPEDVAERLDEIHEEKMDIMDDYFGRIEALVREGNRKQNEFEPYYNFPFLFGTASPIPGYVDEEYDISWNFSEVEDIPDLSDFKEIQRMKEENDRLEGITAYVKTENGAIHSLRENFQDFFDYEPSMRRKYRKVGLTLAENGIRFSDGIFTKEEALKQAGIVDSTNYRQAWDAVYGRPDTVLHLGSGFITFNDTDFSFPWDENPREDVFEEGEVYVGEEGLRPPVQMLKHSWLASKQALQLFEDESYEEIEELLRPRAGKDEFDEEPRFDEESFPEPGDIDPSEFARSWSQGSIDGVPEFESYEEFLETVTDNLEVEDAVFKFSQSNQHRHAFPARLEITGEQLQRYLERQKQEQRLRE